MVGFYFCPDCNELNQNTTVSDNGFSKLLYVTTKCTKCGKVYEPFDPEIYSKNSVIQVTEKEMQNAIKYIEKKSKKLNKKYRFKDWYDLPTKKYNAICAVNVTGEILRRILSKCFGTSVEFEEKQE